MLKARIPLKEIDLFFRRHAASKMKEQRANVQEIGSNSINPRLKPFLKMIDGVPAPGVRQKMIMGRVPPQEIEKFFQTINRIKQQSSKPLQAASYSRKKHWQLKTLLHKI